MIGQKVTELKNGNQGNQATMEPMYFIYKHEKKLRKFVTKKEIFLNQIFKRKIGL